jgi:hypothetical protein
LNLFFFHKQPEEARKDGNVGNPYIRGCGMGRQNPRFFLKTQELSKTAAGLLGLVARFLNL